MTDGELCNDVDEPHFYRWTRCLNRHRLDNVEQFMLDRLATGSWTWRTRPGA